MITLTPHEVQKKFGNGFGKEFFTLIDEKNKVARVIEKCTVKGTVEWDCVNRLKAKGVVKKAKVDGTNLIMDCKIGEGKINFGFVSKNRGAQALSSLKVKGNEVFTTWKGIAGASLGIATCLPQCKNVIKANYSSLNFGGANEVEVEIVSEKFSQLIIGIDDTDNKEKGATWHLALKIAKKQKNFLEHKIIQLNPSVKEKTKNCVSVAVSFAVKENEEEKLVENFKREVKKETLSENTAIAIFKGIKIPKSIENFGKRAKKEILKIEQAEKIAKKYNIEIIEITGKRGIIGCVSAIGCYEMGLESVEI